jgi:hypothetical protein
MKFILLHEAKNDDGIRSFFNDVWELYVKVSFVLRNFFNCCDPFCLVDNVKPVSYCTYINTEFGV